MPGGQGSPAPNSIHQKQMFHALSVCVLGTPKTCQRPAPEGLTRGRVRKTDSWSNNYNNGVIYAKMEMRGA